MKKILTFFAIVLIITACQTNNDTVTPPNPDQPPPSTFNTQPQALVIGNGQYEYHPLANPVNNAIKIATVLTQMGFEVTLKINLNQVTMAEAIREFATRLSINPGVGLFYFAGHGVQVDGQNYLLPIDNLQAYAVNVDSLLTRMNDAKNNLNIILLDACHDDPFSGSKLNVERGLAQMQSTSGSIIVFATAPDQTISVSNILNAGKPHNLFTKYLLEGLKAAHQTHQQMDDMFMQIRNNVIRESGGDQVPWYSANCFGGDCLTVSVPILKPDREQVIDGEHFRDRLRDGSEGPEMVWIPAGFFRMGDIQGEGGPDEKPDHLVSINRFAMSRYEITAGEFGLFVEATEYKTEAEKKDGCLVYKNGAWAQLKDANWRNPYFSQQENHPVVCVSRNDAMAFTAWLSQQTGKQYRLPTEAEWEYAARAGTSTAQYWGNDPDDACDYANVHDETSKKENGFPWKHHNCIDGYAKTAPVGSFKPNDFGLFDILGNVWEWVADPWHFNYDGAPTDGSVWEKGGEVSGLLRGGSWRNLPGFGRVANRLNYASDKRSHGVGFRVVLWNK